MNGKYGEFMAKLQKLLVLSHHNLLRNYIWYKYNYICCIASIINAYMHPFVYICMYVTYLWVAEDSFRHLTLLLSI